MNTHGPFCICPSVNQPWSGNMCLPKLREWVGVKAMTTCCQMWICITVQPLQKIAHKMHMIWYISSNKVFEQLRNSCDWSSNMLQCAPAPGLCPGILYLMHKACPAQIHWWWLGPPMSHGMHRPIVFSQLLTITHKSVKIHEHFLNTIVGTEVQLPCHFAPWQTVLIFKAWEKKKNIFMTSLQLFLAVTLMFVERAKNHIPYILLILSSPCFRNHP